MSLIDVAAELEYVPEQELINLSRNPQSRFPQFLVLSEVQRRNQMRRMYENQVNKAEQPLTTVADEKVMELAQSSAMPNVPSPMSNETSQSPRGLLGMASGQSTSFGPPDLEQQFKNLPKSLTEFDKIIEYEGEKYVIPKTSTIKDFENANTDIITLRGYIDSTRERMLKKRGDIEKADSLYNRAGLGLMEFLNNTTGRLFPNIREENQRILGRVRQSQYVPPETRETVAEYFGTNKSSGGLVSLQQGRTTDYQENIERSLQPAQGGQRSVPSDDPRLYTPFVPVEGGDKSRARRTVLPPALSDLEQAQAEQLLLREDLISTGNLGETGTSQASISEGKPAKTKAEGTNVLQQVFDTSGQLGLPRVEIPRMTEEEKQRELGIYALGIMADAFGTGKNIGEAGSKIGKGVQGLLDIKRTQRQDDIKADSAIRAQSVEDITLANTLLKTQLLQDSYKKQGETNKVKALEILQEEIKDLKENTLGLLDETTKERIAKLQAQLDAELNRMFGTEALATYPGI